LPCRKTEQKHEVFGLDLKPSPYTTIVGDIRDYGFVGKIVSNVDVVVHCAAQTSEARSVEDPVFDAENNVIGTLNLFEAARSLKRLKRFIYMSSASVYGVPEYVPIDEDHPCRPISPYGVSKLAGELYARIFHELYRVPTVCIRPFNVYGKGQDPNSPYSSVISKFLDSISRGLPLVIYGDGKQTRDFINVRDLVELVALALEDEEAVGGIFNCGTGRETSIGKLADLIVRLAGLNLKPIHAEVRTGDIRRSCADIGRAGKVLGFKPKISLMEGLRELLNGKPQQIMTEALQVAFGGSGIKMSDMQTQAQQTQKVLEGNLS